MANHVSLKPCAKNVGSLVNLNLAHAHFKADFFALTKDISGRIDKHPVTLSLAIHVSYATENVCLVFGVI